MSSLQSKLRRLEIAKRLIGGDQRAVIASDLGLTRAKVRSLANDGIRICQLYAEPPVTHYVSVTQARQEPGKFIKAIDLAILGQYLNH